MSNNKFEIINNSNSVLIGVTLKERNNISDIRVGDFTHSEFTDNWYIVSGLPNFEREGSDSYALMRLDGQGYYYKCSSLKELVDKIRSDGGETTVWEKI